MTDWDDESLMRAYQAGDLPAFEALYQRNSARVYGYLKSRLERPEERDEVFQQIFLKLHHSRAQYLSKYTFPQWLFVIIKTVLWDYLRKKRRSPTDFVSDEIDVLENIPSPLSQNEGLGTYSEVAALDSLTVEQKEIVSLRLFDELSYEEIALRLNRSEASVRQILSRTLKKLRVLGRLKTRE